MCDNNKCRAFVVMPLQQKVPLYTKWFHWIWSEFIGLMNGGLVNYTHIL
jgi:hypothetical protein